MCGSTRSKLAVESLIASYATVGGDSFLTFDVSAPLDFLFSFRPSRRGNTNIIKRPTRPMKTAQTTCQDEGNISLVP